MNSPVRRGKLIKWNDDRGFGFIQPDDGTPEVFIHISAIKGRDRRPQVGDKIFYQLTTQADGRVRATHAAFEARGLHPLPTASRSLPATRAVKQTPWGAIAFGTGGIAVALGTWLVLSVMASRSNFSTVSTPAPVSAPTSAPATAPASVPSAPAVSSPEPAPPAPEAAPVPSPVPVTPEPIVAPTERPIPTEPAPAVVSGCVVKGNISHGTGDRLYHVPGMKDYDITRISPEFGEQWFCSEAEAIAAGWRRAPR